MTDTDVPVGAGITHAGVTAEFWATILGGSPTAAEAARRIDKLARAGAGTVFRAGNLLHGTTALDAGPLWADATTELLPGWADRRMPFSQIHGHNSITTWRGHGITVPRPASMPSSPSTKPPNTKPSTSTVAGSLASIPTTATRRQPHGTHLN